MFVAGEHILRSSLVIYIYERHDNLKINKEGKIYKEQFKGYNYQNPGSVILSFVRMQESL